MANRKNQQLINFHGTSSASLEENRTLLNVGEIAVLHGSKANAALAIKISGGTGEDGQLAYFASSNALDGKIAGVQGQISTEKSERVTADATLQTQINTVSGDVNTLKNDVSDIKTANETYDKALQSITATGDTYITVNVGAKDETAKAGTQGFSVSVITGEVSENKNGLAVASDVKSYVDTAVKKVDDKVGTGFTSSSLTQEIVALKSLTGTTTSALQQITVSETDTDANIALTVSKKAEGKQAIGIQVTTGTTAAGEESYSGLATAADVNSSINTAKSDVVGLAGDASTANTVYGAKAYADQAVANMVVEATGDTYVSASATGKKVTVSTHIAGALAEVNATGFVADAKHVKNYVDGEIQVIDGEYKAADTTLQTNINNVNAKLGDVFTAENTVEKVVGTGFTSSTLTQEIVTLKNLTGITNSALQSVEASPATGDDKYIGFTNSKEGTTGKVVADIKIGSIEGTEETSGLADANEVRIRINNVAGDVSTLGGKVNTLIGSDANKSVREIANEELAAQLIPGTAQESLNTLEEIAAWIQSHPDDAAAMNESITEIATITFGGWDASGNPKNEGLSGTVKTLVTGLADETSTRQTADKNILDTIGTGFTTASTETVRANIDALSGRIKSLEDISATTTSALQKVNGSTTTAQVSIAVSDKDENNEQTITVNVASSDVEKDTTGFVTGGAVFTAVSNAKTEAINKANEKVETVALGTVTTATSNQSGAKVGVSADANGDNRAVTLDLSELVIDCGEF